MRLKLVIAFFAVIVLVGGAAAGLWFWKQRAMQAGAGSGPPPEFGQSVQVVEAKESRFQRTINAVGTVKAVRQVMLATEVAGKVVEVGFESGQRVDEGRVLIRLDDSTEQADLRAAVAAAELAKANVGRMESAPPTAVVQMDVDKMRAELLQTQARVEQLRTQIAKKVIKAPFLGNVGMRDIHPGQYVDQGREIASIQEVSDQVHVDFAVPQLQAALLGVGSKLKIYLGVPGMPELDAAVSAIDPRVDLSTRNARLRATTSSMGGKLAPGAFVDVRVPMGEPLTVVTAPPTAIRHAPFGDHVFVIEADPKDPAKMRARQRFIKVGGSTPDGVIVTDGLKPGEKLAGDGSFKLFEGALVYPAAPAGAPGAGGAGPGGAGGGAAGETKHEAAK